MNGSSRDGTVW